MKKICYIFVFLYAIALQNTVEAQIFKSLFKNKLNVEIQNKDITLNPADTTIKIPYTLKGYRNRLYIVKLSYSNNGGNSYKGPLRSIKGNVGDSVRAGKNLVSWSFNRDNPYFDGKNINFKIEAIERPKIATGGPQNALRSILMPGLGDVKVRNGYRYGWIAVGTYACLVGGGYAYWRSRELYRDYRNRVPNDINAHDALYNRAKNTETTAIALLGVGVGIWAADVVGVYVRGMRNRRKIAQEKQKLEAEKNGQASNLRIYPYTDGRSGQIAFLWKF